MNVKKFRAVNMATGIKAIRDDLGPEALIVSKHKIDGGIKIVAATDYDESLLNNTTTRKESISNLDNNIASDDVKSELQQLKILLEQQLPRLAWSDLERRAPKKTILLRRLKQLGFNNELCQGLVATLNDGSDLEHQWQKILKSLAANIKSCNNSILNNGGVVALLRATGVGKTTTIAKLAARFSLLHSADDVLIVSADPFRIAAHEQIKKYSKLLGVDMAIADDQKSFTKILIQNRTKKLILIDSAGVSQFNTRFQQQMNILQVNDTDVRKILIMPANVQAQANINIFTMYKKFEPSSVILTKIDESTNLGSVLSIIMNQQLAIEYITDGQNVPENIRIPRANFLISKALAISKQFQSTQDKDDLAFSFCSGELND